MPEALRNLVAANARHEFVHAFGLASRVGGVVILAAAAVVFVFLPARAGDAREPVEGALDGIASLTFAEAEGQLETDAAAGPRLVQEPAR